MKAKVLKMLVLGLVALSSINFALGQTANEFEKKYSSRTFYEIRPNILMTAEFNKDGQVCKVALQPNRTSKRDNTDYLGNYQLDPLELKNIFDELVPLETREGKGESTGFVMTGSMGFSAYFYENVRFNLKYDLVQKNTNVKVSNQKLEKIEGLDLLFSFITKYPDIAYITWTKRHCDEN